MLKEIVIASKNLGKIKEFSSLLSTVSEKISSLRDIAFFPEIIEDGKSFRENAQKKARAVMEFTQKAALGDDSGLEVEVLDGRPGIFSARYAGEDASDRDNIDKLLAELNGVVNRNAKFVCSLVLIFPDGREVVAEGTCEGVIGFKPSGEGGFGYDPVFFLPELNKTMAELSPQEKNAISHRARAMKMLLKYLCED